jgi:hypothetical protein
MTLKVSRFIDSIFRILLTTTDPIKLITRMFAYAASGYLHLVTHGFQNLDLVGKTISGAMKILQETISPDMMPAVVFPLFVFGCVARQEDKEFFEKTFSSPPVQNLALQHRARILPILEEIWSRRQLNSSLTWGDILELTQDTLLI